MSAPTVALVRHRPAPEQRGVALVLALMVIFMLSIIGMSSLRSSNIETRMTSNAVELATTFQAAESVTDVILNDSGNLSAAWMSNGEPLGLLPRIASTGELATGADLTYVGDGVAPGFSLGHTGGGFISLRFEVLGTAELGDAQAESNIRQGAYRVVPSF